jgi:hypothetical protein
LLSWMASVARRPAAAPVFSWSNRLTTISLPKGCRECLRTSLPCHVRVVRLERVRFALRVRFIKVEQGRVQHTPLALALL